MIREVEANSLSELIQAVHDAEQSDRSQLWFRGHSSHDWPLIPSAHRRPSVLEATFANHFRMRAPALRGDCPQHQDYAAWLPLMQHYGLPTRLLDWTESLIVAAYFASANIKCQTAATIWMLAPGKLNLNSVGNVIPFLTDDRIVPIIREAFGARCDSRYETAISVIAPRRDTRMMVQLGNYTIHRTPTAIEEYSNAGTYLTKIVIPKHSVQTIRKDLSVCGIRRSSLFPDLSNLAAELSEFQALDEHGNSIEEENCE